MLQVIVIILASLLSFGAQADYHCPDCDSLMKELDNGELFCEQCDCFPDAIGAFFDKLKNELGVIINALQDQPVNCSAMQTYLNNLEDYQTTGLLGRQHRQKLQLSYLSVNGLRQAARTASPILVPVTADSRSFLSIGEIARLLPALLAITPGLEITANRINVAACQAHLLADSYYDRAEDRPNAFRLRHIIYASLIVNLLSQNEGFWKKASSEQQIACEWLKRFLIRELGHEAEEPYASSIKGRYCKEVVAFNNLIQETLPSRFSVEETVDIVQYARSIQDQPLSFLYFPYGTLQQDFLAVCKCSAGYRVYLSTPQLILSVSTQHQLIELFDCLGAFYDNCLQQQNHQHTRYDLSILGQYSCFLIWSGVTAWQGFRLCQGEELSMADFLLNGTLSLIWSQGLSEPVVEQ
ncbi:hypothetical protein [Spongorhabdus nitratireducens]